MTPTRRVFFFLALIACATSSLCLWYNARAENAREQVQQVLRQSPSAIVVCNRQGKVLFANERLYTYTGFTLEDLQRDGLATIIPSDLYPAHNKAFARAATYEHRVSEMRYRKLMAVRCKDGNYIKSVITVSTILNSAGGYDFYAFITPLPPEDNVAPPRLQDDFKEPPLPTKEPATTPATIALLRTE